MTPAVAVTRNQDIVHRAVGRPGVVLIGEGVAEPGRSLLATEKKKVARSCPTCRSTTCRPATRTGQVPLRKLNKHLMKLPRNLKTTQVAEVNRRLKALGHDEPADPQGADAQGHADAARPPGLTHARQPAGQLARGSRPSPAGPVVQPAAVAVPDQRRDEQQEQRVRSSARGSPRGLPSSRTTRSPRTS